MTARAGEGTASRSSSTSTDARWVNVWRWAVAVTLVTSAVRSGALATHVTLGSTAWYALQFAPLAVATLATLTTLRGGRIGDVPRWPVRLLALLVLCAAVSVLSAADRHQVILQVGLLAAASIFLLTTYLLRWSDTRTRDVDLRCVYWVFVGIHVVGLAGFAAGATGFAGDFNRYLGVMSNANYAGMTAALALALGASSRRPIDVLGAIPLGLALWASGSLGASLGLACAIVVLAIQGRWFSREWRARRGQDRERLRQALQHTRWLLSREGMAHVLDTARDKAGTSRAGRKLAAGVLIVALAACALVIFSVLTAKEPLSVHTAVGNHFSGRDQGGDLSSGRLDIYRQMLDRVPDHPVFGSGYRTGVLEVRLSPSVTLPLQAHNVYLSVLVELGVVGFLVFGFLLLSILLAGRWSHRLLAAVACALVLELTESAMFGFGGPSALLTWLVLLGFASTGSAPVRATGPAGE